MVCPYWPQAYAWVQAATSFIFFKKNLLPPLLNIIYEEYFKDTLVKTFAFDIPIIFVVMGPFTARGQWSFNRQ